MKINIKVQIRVLQIFLPVFFAVSGVSQEQSRWQDIITVEEVYSAYPTEMVNMLESLNLDIPGLEKVKQSYENNDISSACTALLDYYLTCDNASKLRKKQPDKTSNRVALADTILNDVFIVQNVRGKLPYLEDGHRDWYYKGPNNDREWAWLSNRHSQINGILQTYFKLEIRYTRSTLIYS